MPLNETETQVTLPPELRTRFEGLTHRLWRLETVVALCGAATALAGTWLVVYVSDRYWDTPGWLRGMCALAGTVGWGYAVGWWCKRWVFRRRDWRALANLVQRAHRGLGDRLLGIVELATERQHAAGYSAELYRAAIEQVAREAMGVDFEAAVSLRPARRQALFLGGCGCLVAGAVGLSPATGWNVLERWSRPWAEIPRRTLVVLEGMAERELVAHGEGFELVAGVTYRSWWRPERVRVSVAGQGRQVVRVEGGKVTVPVAGQVEPVVVRLQLGDAEASVAVDPVYRPTLREVAAELRWPEYLRRTNSVEGIGGGTLTVLEGSEVGFRGVASWPLASVEYRWSPAEFERVGSSNTVFWGPMVPVSGEGLAEFRWKDVRGLEGAGPWRLVVQTRRDEAPSADLPELPRDIGLLETEVLKVKVVGRDDLGVRDVGMVVEVAPGPEGSAVGNWPDFKVESGWPRPLEQSAAFGFSPSVFGIPADTTVELRGYAVDDWPGRRAAQSAAYRVHVLSAERHAEMVRKRMEGLLAQLEEVSRLEEQVAEEARNLSELEAEKQAGRETGERIGGVNEDQKQAARQLEQMAREGMQSLREAVRNPAFDRETIGDWTKTLREMQRLAAEAMPKASQALEGARQNPARRGERLAEAKEQTQEIMEALQELQSKVNTDLDEMEALTLAQRLRRLGEDQKRIASGLGKVVADTVGLLPAELPPGLAGVNQRLATNQAGVQAEAVTLQGEISRFFERTRKEAYGEVSKEMVEGKVEQELGRVGGLIAENIALDAMTRLGGWAKRFEDWAAKLEPPKDEASSQGGQGGEQGNDEMQERLMKMLTTLLRTREGQATLQQQTRLMEGQREVESEYVEGTAKLALREEELIGGMGQVRRENPVVELGGVLAEAEMRMVEALTFLRRPQTDEPAVAAHTQAIEALSDAINLINEQAKRDASASSQGQSSPGDEMAFLSQMMAQQPMLGAGMPMPGGEGGNLAGGSTDAAGGELGGAADGRAAEGRAPARAGGAGFQQVPAEFREALEEYYRALEAEEGRGR